MERGEESWREGRGTWQHALYIRLARCALHKSTQWRGEWEPNPSLHFSWQAMPLWESSPGLEEEALCSIFHKGAAPHQVFHCSIYSEVLSFNHKVKGTKVPYGLAAVLANYLVRLCISENSSVASTDPNCGKKECIGEYWVNTDSKRMLNT